MAVRSVFIATSRRALDLSLPLSATVWNLRLAPLLDDFLQFRLMDHCPSSYFSALQFALAQPRMNGPFADST